MGTIRHAGSIRGPRPASSASTASMGGGTGTMTRAQGQQMPPIPQGQTLPPGPAHGQQEHDEPEEEEDLMLESVIIPAIASVSSSLPHPPTSAALGATIQIRACTSRLSGTLSVISKRD